MKTSLAVLAAGIGSRYKGGIKQMESLGPGGEYMIDYAVYDAMEAGFEKVVFIIRHDIEQDFRRLIGDRIARKIEVAYAFQEIDMLPPGFSVPAGRTKPWGTGHALLAAKDCISEPFVVINADDYYGKFGYRALHDHFVNRAPGGDGREAVSMAAFILGNTLSDNGVVTRGILERDAAGKLTGIRETKGIFRTPGGAAVMEDGARRDLDPAALVSMNMWGFYPTFLERLEESFARFLALKGTEAASEYLIPEIVDGLIAAGEADLTVIESHDTWFGVTYQEDREFVRGEFKRLAQQGVYRTPLF